MLWTCMSLRQVGTGEAPMGFTRVLLSDCMLSRECFKSFFFFLSPFFLLSAFSFSLSPFAFPHSLFLGGHN